MSEQSSERAEPKQRPLRSLVLFNIYMALWTTGTILFLSAFVYFVGVSTPLHSYIIWAATTLGVIFVSILVLAIADRRLALSIDEMKDIFRGSLTSIESGIREYVEPSVIFNDDVDQLRKSLLQY